MSKTEQQRIALALLAARPVLGHPGMVVWEDVVNRLAHLTAASRAHGSMDVMTFKRAAGGM